MIDEAHVEIENLFTYYFAVWNILIFENSFTVAENFSVIVQVGKKTRSKKLESLTSCALITLIFVLKLDPADYGLDPFMALAPNLYLDFNARLQSHSCEINGAV